VRALLSRAHPVIFSAWTLCAAFFAYFCMYGFRKPFAVGTFDGELWGVDLKILLIVGQMLGYCLSKFIGIKVVSELPGARRGLAIAALIGTAQLALVVFAVVPEGLKPAAMFLNGMPLGMIWGLVFGFLEGRKVSDFLGAGLCASFIVASGFVKTVGKWLLDGGVPEVWMPAASGAIFLLPMALFTWMLAQVPPPSADDEAARTKRAPMDGPARRAFVARYAGGIVAVVAAYIVLTAYRDFRDNFAREIWDAVGYSEKPEIMTTSELPIAFASLVAIALIVAVKKNRLAVLAVHGLMVAGALLVLATTWLYTEGHLGPAPWMISVGLGLYLAYVPFNCVLFDRLVAAGGSVATAGFMIYVADAFGYLGSVGLLLYKNFGEPDLSWLDFFINFSWVMGIACAVGFGASALYFFRATR